MSQNFCLLTSDPVRVWIEDKDITPAISAELDRLSIHGGRIVEPPYATSWEMPREMYLDLLQFILPKLGLTVVTPPSN